jgi:hypothetical protein
MLGWVRTKLTAGGKKQQSPVPQHDVRNSNFFQITRSNDFPPPKEQNQCHGLVSDWDAAGLKVSEKSSQIHSK